jgi:hypothetical protein
VTSEGSGLSRLTLKFLEVFAAGLATAVSGYLIAHFSGYLAAVTPVAAVKQPSVIQPWVIQQSVRSGPATPVVHEAAPAAAAPQSNMADQSPSANGTGAKPRDAVEIKPRDAVETKPRDTTETRPHEAARGAAAPSFEARVRAALAKAGPANSGPAHPASDDAPRREAVVPVDAMPRVATRRRSPSIRRPAQSPLHRRRATARHALFLSRGPLLPRRRPSRISRPQLPRSSSRPLRRSRSSHSPSPASIPISRRQSRRNRRPALITTAPSRRSPGVCISTSC